MTTNYIEGSVVIEDVNGNEILNEEVYFDFNDAKAQVNLLREYAKDYAGESFTLFTNSYNALKTCTRNQLS